MRRREEILKRLWMFAWRSAVSVLLAIASLTVFTVLVLSSGPRRACTDVEQAQVIKYRAEVERDLKIVASGGVLPSKDTGPPLPLLDCYLAGEEPAKVTLPEIVASLAHASSQDMKELAWAVVVLTLVFYPLLSFVLVPLVRGSGSLLAAVYRRGTRGRARNGHPSGEAASYMGRTYRLFLRLSGLGPLAACVLISAGARLALHGQAGELIELACTIVVFAIGFRFWKRLRDAEIRARLYESLWATEFYKSRREGLPHA
jgi:hypothetical protein